MFKKTMNFSELKKAENFTEMGHEDVYQIFHRGNEVKVMMTQEKYFELLSEIDRLKLKANENVAFERFDSDEILKSVKDDIAQLKDHLKLGS